jgi:hypothetical protein
VGLFKHNSANAEICVAIIQNNKSKGASRSLGNCSTITASTNSIGRPKRYGN